MNSQIDLVIITSSTGFSLSLYDQATSLAQILRDRFLPPPSSDEMIKEECQFYKWYKWWETDHVVTALCSILSLDPHEQKEYL